MYASPNIPCCKKSGIDFKKKAWPPKHAFISSYENYENCPCLWTPVGAFLHLGLQRVTELASQRMFRVWGRGGEESRVSPQGPTQAAQAYPKGAEIMEGVYRYN